MSNHASAERFFELARAYCAWCESEPGDPSSEAVLAQDQLAELYAAALSLPAVEPSAEIEPPEVSNAENLRILRRFDGFPIQLRWTCFDPLQSPPEDPVCGSLADDLADIHRELKPGVELFARGMTDEAIWHWRFHLHAHWGEHALGALYALHWHVGMRGR